MIYLKTPRTRLIKLGGRLFTIGFILASCCIAADPSTSQVIAQGGGTTIVQGGTGKAGGFIPVLTTIAFHAERTGTTITGGFEFLARTPEKNTGSTSAQFTVHA